MNRKAPGATRSLQTPYGYRLDRTVPPLRDDKPVIVFDGMCSLCSGWVRFVLRHDRSGRYRIRLFGRPAACYRPAPGDADRFLA
ncbi:MAG: hypothetical protein ACHQAQ_04120 [Hyphomicrobiales bacterium]